MKRGHGEGSVYPFRNKWRAQITLPEGKRLSHVSKDKKECLLWLRKMQEQVERGMTYSSAQTTFEVFLLDWLKIKQTQVRQKTFEQYSFSAHKYIIPAIGKVKFKNLNSSSIQHFCSNLEASSRTVQICHAVIRGCLEHAVHIGLLSYNPALSIILPRVERKELMVWTEEQVTQFLIFIRNHRNEQLYRLAIATGMRQGELLGLQWKDIDWITNMLKIVRQVATQSSGGFIFSFPKTKYGIRKIELADSILSSLRKQMANVEILREKNARVWRENDLVFPSSHGTPQSRYNLTHEFRNLVLESRLPELRFHDLRHTAASLMLNHGTPVLVASRILGHSKPSITLDLYGHLLPGAQTETARMMSALVHPIEVDL